MSYSYFKISYLKYVVLLKIRLSINFHAQANNALNAVILSNSYVNYI